LERPPSDNADRRTLAQELARLRRFARQPPREDLDAVIAPELDERDAATPTYSSRTTTPAPNLLPQDMSGPEPAALAADTQH
jgi:hypothetical protein